MSSQDEPELKGGHPPAVKAGGMRVARPNKPHHDSGAQDDDSDAKAIQPNANSFLSTQPSAEVAGPVTKDPLSQEHGEHVKRYHEPKLPTHEKPKHQNPALKQHIFQPK